MDCNTCIYFMKKDCWCSIYSKRPTICSGYYTQLIGCAIDFLSKDLNITPDLLSTPVSLDNLTEIYSDILGNTIGGLLD